MSGQQFKRMRWLAVAVVSLAMRLASSSDNICDLGSGKYWLRTNATEARRGAPDIQMEVSGRRKLLNFSAGFILDVLELSADAGLGHGIWPSSLSLSALFARSSNGLLVSGSSVVELGAGIGLTALTAAATLVTPRSVTMTEHSGVLLDQMQANVERNRAALRAGVRTRVPFVPLRFTADATVTLVRTPLIAEDREPASANAGVQRFDWDARPPRSLFPDQARDFDLILGSDLVCVASARGYVLLGQTSICPHMSLEYSAAAV